MSASFSRTVTVLSGKRSTKRYAVARPTMPPPIIMRSDSGVEFCTKAVPIFDNRAYLEYDCSMTRITVNEALLGQLGTGKVEAELCDSTGRRVGYFLPDEI